MLPIALRRNLERSKSTLPDFNTSVDIENHKLTRPKGPPRKLQRPKPKRKPTLRSLIPETLKEMETDVEFQLTAKQLKEYGRENLTLKEKKRLRRSLEDLKIPDFHTYLQQNHISLTRLMPQVFQLNIGLYCNQACNHCHVESSPKRTEMMSYQVATRCLELIQQTPSIQTLDITGGAPELNQQFRYLVEEASKMNLDIIDRCNLTVLEEPGQEDLPEFLAKHKVHIVASLPCYSSKNVNIQRGQGVFERSIRGLQTLNAYGYGYEETDLKLDLVYNPLGAFLPPPQEALEEKYKAELFERYQLVFNNLFTLTNMPIKRFADFLYRRSELNDYMHLLVNNFNKEAVDGVMCRNYISVSWDGRIYDCDFNQQLGIGIDPTRNNQKKSNLTIYEIHTLEDLLKYRIETDNHCYGCTAGMGSSCQGSTI